MHSNNTKTIRWGILGCGNVTELKSGPAYQKTVGFKIEAVMRRDAEKAIMKALKIKFEISKEKPYNPEFVAKIEKSKQEFKEGKSTRVKKEDLQSFLGL